LERGRHDAVGDVFWEQIANRGMDGGVWGSNEMEEVDKAHHIKLTVKLVWDLR
jgi:hypothetical protein